MFKNPAFKKFAPIFIGLGISGLLLVGGFQIFQGAVTRANDISPKAGSVTVTNISGNGATITWESGVETQCVIEYNSSISAVSTGSFAPEIKKTGNHSVDLTLLAPETTYYYVISCENKKFDNEGVPYSFKTLSANAQKTPPATITLPPQADPSVPVLPTSMPTSAAAGGISSTCTETTCAGIKSKLGQGCSMQDYIKKCLVTSPTPTLQVAPKATTAPTGTL